MMSSSRFLAVAGSVVARNGVRQIMINASRARASLRLYTSSCRTTATAACANQMNVRNLRIMCPTTTMIMSRMPLPVSSNNLMILRPMSSMMDNSKNYNDDTSEYFSAAGAAATLLLAIGGAAAMVGSDRNNNFFDGYCTNSYNLTRCDDAAAGHTNFKIETKKSKRKASKKKTKTKKKRSKIDPNLNVAQVGAEDINDIQETYDVDELPVYTAADVSLRDGTDGKPTWVTYGGIVYDITDFIVNHPGGQEKIMQAAGSAVEPYWYMYRQHFASDLPMKLMEHMAIGRLDEKDQAAVDESMSVLEEAQDPYAKEPLRHRHLILHSDQPCNAEVPSHIITKNYLTPNALFYIRHHHPVPYLTRKEVEDYKLKIDLSEIPGMEGKVVEFSLDELKKMPRAEVTATLQCSGNRRSGFNAYKHTSGTSWGQGAISTAVFSGVRLTDVLKAAGIQDPIALEDKYGIQHMQFHALDGMSASIVMQKAANPYGDVIVCYEMNGERLPRDHGFPLRVIVPGYAAVRNVKWLERIQPSKQEAEGAWQRGLNYKTLPPNVTDAKGIDLESMPSMTEVAVFSGITEMESLNVGKPAPGERVRVKAKGWAWAGGGRNIVRVDITSDDGASWVTAKFKEGHGNNQKFGRAWAWTFWEVEIPDAIVREDGSIRLASKAVDMAFNVQPESANHTWNVRGLGNNSWFHAKLDEQSHLTSSREIN